MATKGKAVGGTYVVVRDGIVIAGQEYNIGDPIALDADQAQWLIRDGMIREVTS